MNRRIAILVGSIIAAVAAAEIIVLSGLLAAERHGDRERYEDAISRQRRAAGRLTGVKGRQPTRSGPHTFCVHGVDMFATAARKGLQKELLDGQRNLDTAEFLEISDLAIRAERYVEIGNAGPALPQRLGRSRVAAAEPDDSATVDSPSWKPLEPARVDCEDRDAYAVFRLDIDKPATRPPAAARPAASAPGKKARSNKRSKPKKRLR